MSKLDHKKIRHFSENTLGNKKAKADNSAEILKWFLDYQSNYEEYIRTSTRYFSASTLISDNNWLYDKDTITYTEKISAGMLLAVDFGKCYKNECGYIHTALCLRVLGNKALVVPTTTSKIKANEAYHSTVNSDGNKNLWLGRIEDGFAEESALLLTDIKFISLGRVIDSFSSINMKILEDIRKSAFEIMFPSQVNKFNQKISALEKTIEKLRNEKELLRRENQSLKAKNKSLAGKVKR